VNASAGVSAARLLSLGSSAASPVCDLPRALRHLKRAADVGELGSARVRLAVMHDLGVGGAARDPAEARKYWKLAVESGVAEAHYRCGVLQLHGAGFVKSERAAVNSFRRAQKLGFPLAAQRLGSLRGSAAVGQVEARRVVQADFLDAKYYAAVLYPWPFYDDEVAAFETEEAERAVREAAAQAAGKKAKIEALAAGKGTSAAKLAGEAAAAACLGEVVAREAPWAFPPLLRQHLDSERAQLLQCLDTFAHHLPSRVGRGPPPKPDRVRAFFANFAGLGGLGQLATVPVHAAVVALNGQGQEGFAFSGQAEGYRNAVFDQQGLDAKLGVAARTAKPLTTQPLPHATRGHPNLEGFELRVYAAAAPPDARFRSAAKAEDDALADAKRRAASRRQQQERDTAAIVHIARNGPPPAPEPGRTRQGTARSHKSASHKSATGSVLRGSSSHGGGGGGKKVIKQGPSLATQVLASDEPPRWMYDAVWMDKPLGNGALARAIELRRNYGTASRVGTSAAQSRAARGAS
jgi:hypothetical protein